MFLDSLKSFFKAESLNVAWIGDFQGRLNYLEALDRSWFADWTDENLNLGEDVQQLVLLQQTIVANEVNKRGTFSQAMPNRSLKKDDTRVGYSTNTV